MLGKDEKTDYNAERNHHYKLTLKFKNYANDADWHIEYEHKRGILVASPQFISYLYNKKMMVSVKVAGKIPAQFYPRMPKSRRTPTEKVFGCHGVTGLISLRL